MTADADDPATPEPTRRSAVASPSAAPIATVATATDDDADPLPALGHDAEPIAPNGSAAPALGAVPVVPTGTAAGDAADGRPAVVPPGEAPPTQNWPVDERPPPGEAPPTQNWPVDERPPPGEPLPLVAPLPLPAEAPPRRKSIARLVAEWVLVLGTALAAALLVQAFFLKAFFIPSGSMRPTLDIDDRVLVNKLSYDFGPVQPGDVIVFKKPDNAPPSDVEDFIKRAIAVSGDVIEARDGVVYRNGARLDELYLAPGTTTGNLPRQTVPDGMVFVMGDNRNFSVDSRIFGPIDEDSIVGEALVRVWPPSKIGTV